MRSRMVQRGLVAATWLVLAAVALQIGATSTARAEEIAWRQVTTQTAFLGRDYTREGDATFKNGEVAALAISGIVGPTSSVDFSHPYEAQAVFTFTDGSTIVARFSGLEKADYAQSGSGRFVSGTGRFQGITGNYTFQGKRGDTAHVGTYTLPPR